MCVSVSVTRWYCVKTAKRKTTQTTPRDSPGNLAFCYKDLGEIQTGTPQTGVPDASGVG